MERLAFTPRTLRRFWSKVDKSAGPNGCWPFTGARNHADYGVIWVAGEHGPANWIASRFAYAVEVADPGETGSVTAAIILPAAIPLTCSRARRATT